MRLFNTSLSKEIGSRFGVSQQICLTGATAPDFTQQLDSIQTQLDTITQKIQTQSESQTQTQTQSPVQTSAFQTTTPMKVALYYFNQTVDQKLAPEQQVNINSILPVYRIFPASQNLLVDTINELLKGNLTAPEKAQ
ncbi:MAG: hypothetical protein WCL02_05590 [bacterium]